MPATTHIPDEYYPIMESHPIDTSQCRLSHKTLRLRGPRSPLETPIYSASSGSRLKALTIDPNSVNSVLLTTPEEVSVVGR